MKKIRIGINGFGRIGRLVLRASLERKDMEVVAINDPFIDAEYGAYLFKYDTVHGTSNYDASFDGDMLIINNKKIAFSSEMEPKNIAWKANKVDYVVESSGVFKSLDKWQPHLDAGAKKVVITAPGKEKVPMFICNVNTDKYKPSMNIVSNGSCTTNCLAPLVKVINDAFGIEEGLMTTIHSTTATQLTVDGVSKKDWRVGRAASGNIIPASTGAAKAIDLLIPSLKGKITGMSFRVPALDVSCVDFTCKLKKATTMEEIVKKITDASQGKLKGSIAVTNEDVVSSDFIGNPNGCIFDVKASIMLNPKFIKLVAWYDNELGYSHKVLDLIAIMESKNNK